MIAGGSSPTMLAKNPYPRALRCPVDPVTPQRLGEPWRATLALLRGEWVHLSYEFKKGVVCLLDLERNAQNGKLRIQLPPNIKQITEIPGATHRALEKQHMNMILLKEGGCNGSNLYKKIQGATQ